MAWMAWAKLNWTASVAAIAVAAVSGCGATGDGRYVGTVSAEQGSCGAEFDGQGKATATLLLRGTEAKFAPSDGVVVLDGHINGAGHVIAQNSAAGVDHKPFLQVFEGERTGTRVTGQFASPRCRAAVELARR